MLQIENKITNLKSVENNVKTDFRGNPCAAFSQHGFRGKEKEVMNTIKEIIKTKKLNKYEIN